MFRGIEVNHIISCRACLCYSHEPSAGSEDIIIGIYFMMIYRYFYYYCVRILYIFSIRDSIFISTKRKPRYNEDKQWCTYKRCKNCTCVEKILNPPIEKLFAIDIINLRWYPYSLHYFQYHYRQNHLFLSAYYQLPFQFSFLPS